MTFGGSLPQINLSVQGLTQGDHHNVICLTVDHSNLLTTPKDNRANRYINERLHLKGHLPGSVPLEYLSFCVRGKFCHLAKGNRGFIVVKGSSSGKLLKSWDFL
ncbi:hypothetical protein TNCV_3093301 [Trichonephila clavipes]|nr:hypothetical protein TNCV_3093301 [Trichonephila clavipes]